MRFEALPSLRWRLVAVMGLAYIIVAFTTEIVGYNTQSSSLHRQLETRASADAAILSAGAIAPLHIDSLASLAALRDFVHSLHQAKGLSSAVVYGRTGCPLTWYGTRRPPCISIPLPAATTALKNGDVEGVSPIVDSTTFYGLAAVILSGKDVQNDLQATLVTDLVLRSIGFVIFLILSLVIAQYVLGPVTELARAAGAIRHGDLKTRVSVMGKTELATVAEAFNDMATALEQRIRHLSFLAESGSILPGAFRDGGDATPTLQEFCRQLEACGVGLIPRDDTDRPAVWYDAEPANRLWRSTAAAVCDGVVRPTSVVAGGYAVMVVPVLGNTVFVAARDGERPFSQEEQQVITNFAYQLGIASDNARLFESQQEALQVKDQFLSIVSHELRTPLTTIKGYAQMLRRKLAHDQDTARFATNIDAQVSRLGRLVDDLLDVTRFARGQFELRRQRLDLRPLLEDVIARFQMVSSIHSFRLDLDHGSFEGYWDRDRLEQVLNNLVSNAIKYSPRGGEITVSTRHEEGTLTVAVRDEGIGIDAKDQAHLFERFYRGSAEKREVTGLGLGLYVTRRIVEAHGGSIRVRSAPDQGSEFYFTLPLARRPAPTAVH